MLRDKPEQVTRHHVIAKQKWGTFHPDNIVLLTRSTHDCVHALLWNDLPFEIIRWILDKYKNAIDNDAYSLVNWVLVQVEKTTDAYNPNCFNPKILSRFIWW